MTSPSPLLYDTYYHIYHRGINRENIFIRERNYEHFMNLYTKYIEPVADTYAYCLLKNHFHLLVRVKSKEEISQAVLNKILQVSETNGVSRKFSDFFNAYAKAINSAYGRTGSLFQHPFGRVLVTSDRQFWNVVAYIHQNPQKHKFVEDFRDWKWSSYGAILSEKPTKLQREYVINWFGGKKEYIDLHAQWVSDVESRWFAEDDDYEP
jgi:putative transposase